ASIPLGHVVTTADAVCWTRMRGPTDGDGLKRLARNTARLMAAEGVLAAAGPPVAARALLRAAGFLVTDGSSQDILVGRRDPAVPFRRPARLATAAVAERRAVIVGAGLAGCATAWALAEHGWRSVVLDRHPGIASEGSGQPAGVFHG